MRRPLVPAIDWDAVTARSFGRARREETEEERRAHRRVCRAVEIARELEADVLERGLGAPWVADAIERGDAPQPAEWIAEHWVGAFVALLRWAGSR